MEELIKILGHFGYNEIKKGKTGGSRRRFADDSKHIIHLHKPHPGNILKHYQVKQIIEILKERFLSIEEGILFYITAHLMVRVKGEAGLNELRDKARIIAEKLEKQNEFDKLNKLISALLTTYPSKVLSSPLAVARVFGNPYDPARLPLFEKLFIEKFSSKVMF